MNQDKFEKSMMRELSFFFGIWINQLNDRIFIIQSKHTKEILQNYKFINAKSFDTPKCITTKSDKDEKKNTNKILCHEMIRLLLSLTTTRHNIMSSIIFCARFQSCTKVSNFIALK